MKLKDAPKEVRNTLTAGGKKLWSDSQAKLVDRRLLAHYAMALNSQAEYMATQAHIAELEEKNENTLVQLQNGLYCRHPLRQQLDASKRSFETAMSKAGLVAKSVDEKPDEDEEEDRY